MSETLLADGSWCSRTHLSGESRAVIEVATGVELKRLRMATPQDVHTAAARAAEAQREWAARPPSARATVLRTAAQLWMDHRKEVEDWLIREAGSVRTKAAFEVGMAVGICFEAAALPTHPRGEVLATEQTRWSLSRRLPVGVVSVISPFNYPLILAIRSVAPALALGNAVLLKPDPRTAICGGVALLRIFEEAGLPPGLLQLLPGGADVGAAVIEAPEVGAVSFTGSTGAGRVVGATAAKALKRVHLELGGNNAIVVLPGADIPAAASAGAFGSYLHQGQICMATGRHLVHESQFDEYVSILAAKAAALPVGDPYTEDVALGPIIDGTQLAHIEQVVNDAVAAGATVVTGGKADPPFYPPTVLTGLDTQNPAWRKEIFGPVAPVLAYRDLDEAARIVNDSEYGLSVGILGDVGLALPLAEKLHSGKVHINEQTVDDEPTAPFGGMKDSGNGARFGGAQANIEAFTETQWVTVRPTIATYPF
ncbi:aldehyde dehydrogenase family protein [Pseudonocardiaceae bacterium YIM PH 21723]|nr:aldehyde dehydrogenase family protein [Pseudonocardiaceae bacterium YIM PH 21723]